MRPGIRIGGVDIDFLDRHTESFRANLSRHRFHPLSEIDRRERDGEFSGRVRMDQRLARITAEIHADRIVDGRDAASAMVRHDQRLLVPKTEEKRRTPCVDSAGGVTGDGCELPGDSVAGGIVAAGRS